MVARQVKCLRCAKLGSQGRAQRSVMRLQDPLKQPQVARLTFKCAIVARHPDQEVISAMHSFKPSLTG